MGGLEGSVREAGHAPAAGIETQGLTKSYGSRTALDGVTLTVAPGSVLGLLGPNGAGKTTLIRMLSTVLRPDRGTFTVAGVPDSPADGDPPADRRAPRERRLPPAADLPRSG